MSGIGIGINIAAPQTRGGTIYEDVTSIELDTEDAHDFWSFNDDGAATDKLVFGTAWVKAWTGFSFDLDGAIAQGTAISSAVFEVTVISSTGSPDFNVGCEAIDIAALPLSSNNPKEWDMTDDYTNVTNAPSDDTTEQIDITTAVQEIINRSGWDEGRINVFVEGTQSSVTNFWYVEDFDGGSNVPGKLTIQYH
jgi:hypothetical protein